MVPLHKLLRDVKSAALMISKATWCSLTDIIIAEETGKRSKGGKGRSDVVDETKGDLTRVNKTEELKEFHEVWTLAHTFSTPILSWKLYEATFSTTWLLVKSHGKRNHICLLPVKHWNHSLAVRIALLWSHCRTVDSNSQRAFAPRCPAAWMQSYDSVVSPIDSRLVLGSARRGTQRSVSNTGECAHSYWVSKPGHTHWRT